MKKKRPVLLVLLIVWATLASLVHSFLPDLTGNRVIDAILVSAVVTSMLAELFEVLWGVFLILMGREWRRGTLDRP